ncbi:NAD(P)-binding protein [Aquibacillus salsiterrae]|uniref:precorrin-2 dehydrogenase n=1 Tax=Aquibacillus salsiterrae TaxID=2950439 RepID=A0A9X3WFC7_9BACI|nr:NAD(P)-binding protein [Aquibacillus salsiterrae]MDC3417973.1 NAD(P)-binding protein [Aquibacillus salsiterrae]
MNFLPLSIDLSNKQVLVVGGGKIAERRINKLIDAHADITVISPTITDKLLPLVNQNIIKWNKKKFEPKDLTDAFLVMAATNDSVINKQVVDATPNQTLINVVDNPNLGNIQFPTHFRRGRLSISITTDGASPKLAKKIKNELAKTYDSRYELYLDFLFNARQLIKKANINKQEKDILLEQLLEDKFLHKERQQKHLHWLTTLFKK